jgi:phospholipid/cholesterol/gamma-HCH transport system substrate-binding protein
MRKSKLYQSIGTDALMGTGAAVVVVVLLALAYTGTLKGLFTTKPDRIVRAQFADTKQLRPGDEVRINGVKEGEVEQITYDRAARAATVEMKILDDAGKLYRDASAAMRFGSLLGGRFYIDLDRGTVGDGTLTATIPKSRTWSQVEVDDIATTVNGAAATGLQAMPAALGQGLADPAPVAGSLTTLSDIAPDVQKGVGAVRGLDAEHDIATLVTQTDKTVAALDTPQKDLRSVVSGAASLVKTTAARSADLRSLFEHAPAAMQLTNATLDDLDGTLGYLDPLIGKLQPAAGDVVPTIDRLRPLVTGASTLLQRAEPLVFKLRPAVTSLAAAAHDALPLLHTLRPSIDKLQKSVLPWLNERDPGTGLTVAEALGPGIYGLGSIAGQEDAQGHFVRFPATAGNSSAYILPCQIYAGNPDKDKLLECNDLMDTLQTYLKYDPFGNPPGTAPSKRRADHK